jgi:hypothetical protein
MTMQGPHQAKYFANSYLEKDLPGRLVKYRNSWNLSDDELPEPQKYLIHEPVAIDHWPTLITVAISMSSIERKDYTRAFDPRFDVVYAMRTYVWVKDDDSELCTIKRDRLTTVLRSAFLDTPSLNRCATQEGGVDAMIDESSIREEYSDLTLIKGERVMAGAFISYNLTLTEISTIPIIGTASEYEVQLLNVALAETFENL